ncbi:patatin-like phospholipase family protein [Sphingomonas sp. BGYR3]|uniref:patatin-like phospholipase family protein n=1 Tax=Sphingomonas sp. BGYR3 TaxID=2975483 RepID=UPI0021A311D4|nr:patatin-like phospholipase family protein [Sphingomonas sp. BGYR3]MDG5489388.1 patatin-like phospholipase family protein [Sphingomonas sp. BGYR3]
MADANPVPARRRSRSMPLPDCVALVLQGGGALGSYQAGVFQALDEAGVPIDWVAGISIGAVNAAIIAGNPPGRRLEQLHAFWSLVTSGLPSMPIYPDDRVREAVHEGSAAWVATFGVPGFFRPRWMHPMLSLPGSCEALSLYDTAPLAETLNQFVDWDRLNSGEVRLSVGAVNVETGNFRFFDTTTDRIDARHIMASGALPPGLPPVEIDGCWWWDGGLVSNTPLTHVLDHQTEPTLVFQVDLFPSRGKRPQTISDVTAREKEIRYSSRTRQITDDRLKLRREREAIRRVIAKLPAELRGDRDVRVLEEMAQDIPVSIVHLIHRRADWQGGNLDFEFSAATMRDHWQAGLTDVARTMANATILAANIEDGKTAAYDLTR